MALASHLHRLRVHRAISGRLARVLYSCGAHTVASDGTKVPLLIELIILLYVVGVLRSIFK
jgi:hypothetical protein